MELLYKDLRDIILKTFYEVYNEFDMVSLKRFIRIHH
jgi:hypothetical protein